MQSSLSAKLDSSIYYILITPDEETDRAVVYQGYTAPSLALTRLVRAVMHLPPKLYSHHHAPEDLAKFRLCAEHQLRCAPLMVSEIKNFPFDSVFPLCVFLSSAETDDAVADHLSQAKYPLLHIRSDKIERIMGEYGYGGELIRQYASRVAAFVESESPNIAAKILSMTEEAAAAENPRQLEQPEHCHNVTRPNETPIELSGGRFNGMERVNTFEDAGYADAIRRTALFMNMERERLHKAFSPGFRRQTTDLIITCPGILYHLSSSARLRELRMPKDASTDFKKAFLFFAKQEGYATMVTPEEVRMLVTNPTYHFFVTRWHEEIEAYTVAITFQSFIEFCPVVRLPRKLYRCRGAIAKLGNLLRAKEDPSPESVNKLANRICSELELVASEVLDGFFEGQDRVIRIAADLPLGWMRSGGIPLMLRHYVSQVPTVPGAFFINLSLVTERRFFNIGVRQRVTVIRSFGTADPLRHVFENCVKKFAIQDGWDFDVEFVDVGDEEEFVAACETIRSPFLIFDGHGSHGSDSQIGVIHIGAIKLDVWHLRGRVKIPPIVMLSCCDAAPSDRSHATTANGFLSLGARTVFAPMFPVYGVPSAIMVARLLYRITTVSRLWTRTHRLPLSWLEIVTAQIRACYTTDLLLQLVNEGFFKEEKLLEINMHVTNLINCYDPQWYESLKSMVITNCGWSPEQFDSYIEKSYTIPQALHYLQLGFPDKILLCTEDFIFKGQNTEGT